MLFKEFAGIDAVPILLNTKDVDEIVSTIKNIAPSFGAINLEDISAPRCFEIEERLKAVLDIPVMHDDQHGTAIVVLAGLINALKLTGREFASTKFVIVGAGAAGTAIAKLLASFVATNIIVVDSKGIIGPVRADLNDSKKKLLAITNPDKKDGSLADSISGADVVVGVSGPNIITAEMIASMAPDSTVFALSNPTPEVMPDIAKGAGAKIVATGRSDFPNQINNVLAYPGVFRGVLDIRAPQITEAMKVAAARALAAVVISPSVDEIIPDVFDPRVMTAVSEAVKGAV